MRRGLGLLVAGAGLSLAGCWSSPTVIDDVRFSGPPVAMEAAEGRHLLVATAPTPGWTITIDRTEPLLDVSHIFLTMVRPDPGALYPQVVVEQRVLTDVPQSRPIDVYARVVDFGQRKNLPPYHPVGQPARVD